MSSGRGMVYLVGAGPGDPELLTLRGLRCLRRAEVVLYDRLVDPRLLEWAPPQARRLFVGKRGGGQHFAQMRINRLLVREARRGRCVVRLKGGDPFLLGRGGEEALYLARRGIPFQVVPGVSSALAVPAAAGIPVTHRGLASSLLILPGQTAAGSPELLDWAARAPEGQSLVVLMPLLKLREILTALLQGGRSAGTPVALICAGTLPQQEVYFSSLGELLRSAAGTRFRGPALLVVGAVVRVGQELRWLGRLCEGGREQGRAVL